MISDNQGRVFLRLLDELYPHLRTDRALPSRFQQRLAREKRFGSRDRRLYRELFYTTIRYLPWLEELAARSEEEMFNAIVWLTAEMPATRPLKAALSTLPAVTPYPVAEKAAVLGVTASLLPEWFRAHCPAAFSSPEIDVLHARPSLWLRLQTDEASALKAELDARGWQHRLADPSAATNPSLRPPLRPIPIDHAIEVLSEADVTQTDAYASGQIEIQDLGSQLLLHAVGVPVATRWLDACAGAGGKSLQLARLIGPQGRVEATDPRGEALEELRRRASRAGRSNIAILRTPPSTTGYYDGVLIDAPCSGTGTWRRFPHLKACTAESDVLAAAQKQTEILNRHAALVRPGGLLVYATCSLSRRENEEVVATFLSGHPEYSAAAYNQTFGAVADHCGGLTLLPSLHNTDGFYVAALRRKPAS